MGVWKAKGVNQEAGWGVLGEAVRAGLVRKHGTARGRECEQEIEVEAREESRVEAEIVRLPARVDAGRDRLREAMGGKEG